MAKRDGTSFDWSSPAQAMLTGMVMGALMKSDIRARPTLTDNEDYTNLIQVEYDGRLYHLRLTEVTGANGPGA